MQSGDAPNPEPQDSLEAKEAPQGRAGDVTAGGSDDTAPSRPVKVDWIGRTLGKYRIVGLLGRGGMGIVYQARRSSGEEVALKVCLGLSERCRERRRRTIEAAGQVLTSQDAPRLAAPLEGFVLEHEGDERCRDPRRGRSAPAPASCHGNGAERGPLRHRPPPPAPTDRR